MHSNPFALILGVKYKNSRIALQDFTYNCLEHMINPYVMEDNLPAESAHRMITTKKIKFL